MRLPLEGTLLEKLRKIEALHAGTKIDGEREAARRAAGRIRARLAQLRGHKTLFAAYVPEPRGSGVSSSRVARARDDEEPE